LLPGWAPRFPLDIMVNGSAVAAVIVGVRRWRPDPALPRWLMAVSQAVYTVADFVFYWRLYLDHVEHFPGLADVFYLGRLPFMVAGLALLVRRRSGRVRVAVIDSLIVGVGVGILSWVFLMEPYTNGALSVSARLASLAYPVTDLMLTVMAVRLLAGDGRRGPSLYFLTGGLILLAATGSAYGWLDLHRAFYGSGLLVQVGWLGYYLTMGACALHPSMRELGMPGRHDEKGHPRTRLVALGAATLVGPALLAGEAWLGRRTDALPIAFSSVAVIVLVVLRLADGMRHQAQAEAQVHYQAFHDPLTGLANRALFYDRLEHALEVNRRHPHGLAVISLDLDRLKLVNDSLGHAAGDEVLVAVGQRVRACLRSTDTVARLGGDEFVVLEEGVNTFAEAGATAQRMIDALAEPLVLAGRQILTRASVGVALAVTGNESAELLLSNADAAMYTAKRELPGTYRLFEPAMHVSSPDVGLEVELRRALKNRELVVHYQPIASLGNGEVTGVEALVRWEHPQRGLVPPAAFVPAAEASGTVVDIGAFVLRQACRQMKYWHECWPEHRLNLSVNLSAHELAQTDLVSRIDQNLRDSGLEPRFLTLELTESALVVDPVTAGERFRALKELGVKVALDDFGTEFSSLTNLRRLPVDCLKIDKSFVDTVAVDNIGFGFVRAVVGLAHSLGLTTVAEGVEQADQVNALRRAGCDLMQGYVLARALPVPDVEVVIGPRKINGTDMQLAGAARYTTGTTQGRLQ
jgi:diguanylate cyclase (GGDEF)-like protein